MKQILDLPRWYVGSSIKKIRFYVSVRLFRSGSQMTSKYGKNKKVAHEAQFATDDLTTF